MISESGLDELVVLYVLPVLLAGLELGLSGGAGAAAIAILLMLVASGHQSELNVVGLATSTSVFVIAACSPALLASECAPAVTFRSACWRQD